MANNSYNPHVTVVQRKAGSRTSLYRYYRRMLMSPCLALVGLQIAFIVSAWGGGA